MPDSHLLRQPTMVAVGQTTALCDGRSVWQRHPTLSPDRVVMIAGNLSTEDYP
ncbi:hypothetical protein [Chloroflexus sp.]|uniref:hypothetical protein n=1 Tax=Chloroflexus sp. TaxID=1904827 RepID=UPI002ACDBC20|nr:hypothetical protein [Chloroflexus sp.]